MKLTLKKTLKATMLITTAMLGLSSTATVAMAKETLSYAYRLEELGNYKEAARIYKDYAEQGDATAQLFLGSMYEKGKGVAQDYRQAAKWYQKASEQGEAYSQAKLGLMYYHGKGVAQDYRQAEKWFQKAAEQGDNQAQFNLGVMYYNGEGVKKNIKTSKKWFEKACNNYSQRACGKLRSFK